jgi:hypothetical protein
MKLIMLASHAARRMAALAAVMRAFVVLALPLLLAGCFASERPMFLAASAVPALEGGRHGLYERVPSGY